ncbi:hypothetical protein LRY65_04880 [Candidatus Woesebacteria bacterium]|nr:hypothetical protein [Candidatus Woesebacteria bacterium]
MAVTTLELLRMPISNISPRGEITQPERGEEHRGIQRTLQARGKPVFSQDGFGIFSLPANSPHTKGPHDVWWFNDERTPEYIHWEENSSDAIFTGNTRFWQTLQRQLHQKLAHHGDQFRAYSYLGFLLPDDYQNLPPNVYSHGLQSQKCPHWHITESIIPHPADGWLDARNSDDRNNIARGLNLGGEAMVAHFEKTHPALFQGFGTKIKTEQTIGTVSRERTFFCLPRFSYGDSGEHATSSKSHRNVD